jgi:DNA-binding transcriptional LysR family regulator
MVKNAQTNWDDIRFVVAVADHGSVAAAARVLSVNHATVLRRIQAFETRQGLRIFDKSPRGYQVSADRHGLIASMRDAAASLGQVEQMIEADRPNLQGGVRVTTTDTFAQTILPNAVARFVRELGLQVDVIAENSHLDLGRLQAHVTVRPAVALPKDLVGEQVAEFRFGVYAADETIEPWLGLSGPPARSTAGAWLRAQPCQPILTADSFLTLAGIAAQGLGRAVLPVVLGDRWPGLTRVSLPEDLKPVPLWVASHADFAQSGRLRRVRRVLSDVIAEFAPRLMGDAP